MTLEFDAITAVRITRYNKHNFKRIPSKVMGVGTDQFEFTSFEKK